MSICHWSNFYWLRFPFPNIEKYNLGKVYISAKQPIEFNSELDDKSRFENVDHLEKYIIWWVNKHFVYKKNGLICDMYDVKTYVDFYFWEYMWLSDWLILCNFTPEMVSIFQEQFFWWICCGETVEIYVCQRSSSHSDVIISVGSSEPVTVRVSVTSWNRLTFPLSLSLSLSVDLIIPHNTHSSHNNPLSFLPTESSSENCPRHNVSPACFCSD